MNAQLRTDERSADRGRSGMRIGALLMPSHPPERSVVEGQQWDLREIQRLDRFGFDEVWIGEHFTAAWEPCPAPDLLIAQALQLGGEKGYIRVSFTISPDPTLTAGHWDAVVQGAMRSGLTPDRGQWRVIRDVYVAPTDDEARALAIAGPMGRCWREFLLPLYLELGLGPLLTQGVSVSERGIDLDFLADNLWLVGSPATVSSPIAQLPD